ncbi:MAG: NAD(P)H-hydrate dehydratase [Odoribacter sp.]
MEKLNKIYSTSQIHELDKYTIENEPISALDLMERAAMVWCECFVNMFKESAQVAVFVGTGNNGGDGYAIARLLQERGREVVVYRVMTGAEMSPECEANYQRWIEMEGKVKEMTIADDLRLNKEVVVIDALFGSGLNRPLRGLVKEVIQQLNAGENMIVAVDLPSGLMGEDNSQNDREAIVRADYTFTFQFPKLAFMLPENAPYVGEWQVLSNIGLHPEVLAKTDTPWNYITADVVERILPTPEKFAHKGMNGRGLLIAGSVGMMGAAILAAKAAVRSGVGLLYCHVPTEARDLMQMAVPEALLEIDPSQVRFTDVCHPMEYDAVAVGPAIGQDPETAAALRMLLQHWKGRMILDADALNLMAEHRDLLELLQEGCILTPHLKEFERLAGKSGNDFERLNKLSIFANRYHVNVVLKGAYSVIATPEGHLFFNMSGNPGMAKGGSGDVLTGVLLGLAANGLDMLEVAVAGVYAHGLSGDIVAEEQGCRGVTSGMIAEGMGKAWKKLERGVERKRVKKIINK